MQVFSITKKGRRTEDNRDVILELEKDNVCLYMVLDGSSTRSGSGDYARSLAENIKEQFENLSRDELLPRNIKGSINNILLCAHASLRTKYPSASLSLVILVTLMNKVVLIFNLGDCALGRVCRDNSIVWLTMPHTLCRQPISRLRKMPNSRNRLVRSFKARRLEILDWVVRPFHPSNVYVLASDGYWEGHNSIAKEIKSVDEIELTACDDDLSICVVRNS
jgi:serine/threonine protein phosphatase PrpC